jgi:DNA ligase-1
MLRGATGPVAFAALTRGDISEFALTVGQPVRPMLASTAPDVAAAMAKIGAVASIDTKLDGIRVQAHKDGDIVRLFTRSLDDITIRLPEVVTLVRGLPVGRVILDGEVLMIDDAGRPRPFQETASRTASQGEPVAHVSAFFFDVLAVDDEILIDQPLSARLERLDQLVPSTARVGRCQTADPLVAQGFFAAAVESGQEGVVVKALDAPYEAGRRGAGWIKVKPRHTLDLVVLAVEWGSGRRSGLLSNIHLGARDPETGGWVMLGKTFKGMTDEMLAWQTAHFTELADGPTDGYVVPLRPEQVVEIAFDGLQRSTRYPGGLALRFARVLRYRDDKTAEEADTIDTVRLLAGW